MSALDFRYRFGVHINVNKRTEKLPSGVAPVEDINSRSMNDSKLNSFSPEFETTLRTHARVLRLPNKGVLYKYGGASDGMYCLERGLLRLSVTSENGREAVLNVIRPGRWFGEACLLGEEPRINDARAITDCDVLVVPADSLRKILFAHSEYMFEITRMICKRYRLSLMRNDASILLPLQVRMAKRILEGLTSQCPNHGAIEAPVLRVSQEALSQMLGVSRQSVNRLLKEWETRSILRVSYGQIALLDVEALQSMI